MTTSSYTRNVLWLGGIQAAHYILPIVTVPYLTRTLGPTGYGINVYTLSLAAFLSVICDYGFALTATKAVSAHRNEPARVRDIFSSVLMTKFMLLLICCVLLGISTVALPHYTADWRLYALAILGAFSAVLFPTWLFQGLERMRDLALMSLSARILSVAAIFIFVRGPDDMWLATLLQLGASFVMALLAQLLAHRLLGGRVTMPTFSSVTEQLREGWTVFVSSLAINLYTTGQTMIVGSIGGAAAAGYYGAAEKCVSVGKSGYGILTQAAVPKVAYYAKHDPLTGLRFIRKLMLLAPIGLVATFVMFFYPEWLVKLLFGAQFIEQVTPLFQILSPVPFILTLSSCFATLFMFNYGYHHQWAMIIVSACCLSLVVVLGLHFVVAAEQAAAWATMLAEAFILVVSATYFFRGPVKSA